MRTLVTAIVIAMVVALIVQACEGESRSEKRRKAAQAIVCQVLVEAGLVKSCGLR